MKVLYSYLVMDILHRGHLRMLSRCKDIAGPNGRLVVGVLTDEAVREKKVSPTLSFEHRLEIARSIQFIDEVVPQTTYSPLANVEFLRPDVLIESDSHDDSAIEQAWKLMSSLGGIVIVIPYHEGISSTLIKQHIRDGGAEPI